MSDTALESAGLSRRSLMKVGLIGGAFSATAGVTASLTGCSAEKPASGLEKVPRIRPAVPPCAAAGDAARRGFRRADAESRGGRDPEPRPQPGAALPEMFKLTQQLFDVLALPLTRGPLTGIWGSWGERQRRRRAGIPFALGKQLHRPVADGPQFADATGDDSLVRPPEAWAHCGYPDRRRSLEPPRNNTKSPAA